MNIRTNGVTFDSYMLKEANDPDWQASAPAPMPTDRRCLPSTNRLVIPAGKVVKFIVTADDVIHSFAMPAFWIKQDANPASSTRPGPRSTVRASISASARELCGARHAYMPIAIEVVPPAQFNAWVASKGGTPGAISRRSIPAARAAGQSKPLRATLRRLQPRPVRDRNPAPAPTRTSPTAQN